MKSNRLRMNILFVAVISVAATSFLGCSSDKKKSSEKTQEVTDTGNPADNPKPSGKPAFQINLARKAAKPTMNLVDSSALGKPVEKGVKCGLIVATTDGDFCSELKMFRADLDSQGRLVSKDGLELPTGVTSAAQAKNLIYFTQELQWINADNALETETNLAVIDSENPSAGPVNIRYQDCAPTAELRWVNDVTYDSKRETLLYIASGWKTPGVYDQAVTYLCSYDTKGKSHKNLQALADAYNSPSEAVTAIGKGLFYNPGLDLLMACLPDSSAPEKTESCTGFDAFDPTSGEKQPDRQVTFENPIKMTRSWFQRRLQMIPADVTGKTVGVVNMFDNKFDQNSIVHYEYFLVDLVTGKTKEVHSSIEAMRASYSVAIDRAKGDMVIVATYGDDSGEIVLDIDQNIADQKLLIVSYRKVRVRLTGIHTSSVAKVVISSYDSGSTVQGIDQSKVEILAFETDEKSVAATFEDPRGSSIIVGQFTRDADTTVLQSESSAPELSAEMSETPEESPSETDDPDDGPSAAQVRHFAKVKLGGSTIRGLANLNYEGNGEYKLTNLTRAP